MNSSIKIPKIIFKKWFNWNDNNGTDFIYSGIYIIAKFKNALNKKVNVLDKDIIYVGETCKKTLRRRLRQFDKSAKTGKPGHSGGVRYHKEIKDNCKNLYVSILPIDNRIESLKRSYIKFVERKLIFGYCKKYNKLPLLNKD